MCLRAPGLADQKDRTSFATATTMEANWLKPWASEARHRVSFTREPVSSPNVNSEATCELGVMLLLGHTPCN